jgi:hypothetical protein
VVEHPARSLGSSQVYKEHQHFLLNFAPPVEAALFALALLYHTIQKISYRVSNSFNQGEMNMAAASLAHSFTHSHTQARSLFSPAANGGGVYFFINYHRLLTSPSLIL